MYSHSSHEHVKYLPHLETRQPNQLEQGRKIIERLWWQEQKKLIAIFIFTITYLTFWFNEFTQTFIVITFKYSMNHLFQWQSFFNIIFFWCRTCHGLLLVIKKVKKLWLPFLPLFYPLIYVTFWLDLFWADFRMFCPCKLL